MLVALRETGLTADQEVPIPVSFHGVNVGTFHADLVVSGLIVLELKVSDEISKPFEAQLLNYLRSSEMEVGLILAFGERLRFRRMTMLNEVKRRGRAGTNA